MHLLIPAAGRGRRMGAKKNKLLLPLMDRPLMSWTLEAVAAASSVSWIGLIGQPEDFPAFEAILAELTLAVPVQFAIGGATRQESVFAGLQALPAGATQVAIHDGARCLATPALFDRLSESLAEHLGAIAAVPVKDTLKLVNEQRMICATPDRTRMWAAQTPQGFAVPELLRCHREGRARGWQVTDDAALFERCELPVQVVEGEETNLKVTTPVDLAIAEVILRKRGAT
ncbi:2-C-methyl-D-erythritol 4-phosphate cytidylyltransferase [Rubidibacter lacunae KORDI 51-2]|uniref:2-C-methyl-D-erythritol 4-phosphate cytidylyltransferase n=1 Tax=Rubidibacter lacunae KORDI 51-2 TaxID=582515 RepID=U5DFJ3_9CHRO|nr:2-C-methyl-D-erythritol 4-phosphate cytidylyltransferase [Rubidibacter lacunae]ERN40052.1 2-C-methyl-D-erythritol 4-phosphate cytidylyltransferase [Rubidibacter lacunae KORDI 51-2]